MSTNHKKMGISDLKFYFIFQFLFYLVSIDNRRRCKVPPLTNDYPTLTEKEIEKKNRTKLCSKN